MPALRSRPSSLLLLRPETPPVPPVLVGWDGTAAGERALILARALAGAAASSLVIVLPAATREQAEELAARLEERFGASEALPRALPIRRLDRAMAMAATLGYGLVVWPDPAGDLELGTAAPPCSLLLVR
jgi:regulator of protease activity HflC (stomatin/prohibitin superfamily)